MRNSFVAALGILGFVVLGWLVIRAARSAPTVSGLPRETTSAETPEGHEETGVRRRPTDPTDAQTRLPEGGATRVAIGTVVDEFDRPVPLVRVSTGMEAVWTGAEGRFRLPTAHDTVSFSRRGFVAKEVRLPRKAGVGHALDLGQVKLLFAAHRRFRIVDDTGMPVRGQRVLLSAFARPRDSAPVGGWMSFGVTDDQGWASRSLPPNANAVYLAVQESSASFRFSNRVDVLRDSHDIEVVVSRSLRRVRFEGQPDRSSMLSLHVSRYRSADAVLPTIVVELDPQDPQVLLTQGAYRLGVWAGNALIEDVTIFVDEDTVIDLGSKHVTGIVATAVTTRGDPIREFSCVFEGIPPDRFAMSDVAALVAGMDSRRLRTRAGVIRADVVAKDGARRGVMSGLATARGYAPVSAPVNSLAGADQRSVEFVMRPAERVFVDPVGLTHGELRLYATASPAFSGTASIPVSRATLSEEPHVVLTTVGPGGYELRWVWGGRSIVAENIVVKAGEDVHVDLNILRSTIRLTDIPDFREAPCAWKMLPVTPQRPFHVVDESAVITGFRRDGRLIFDDLCAGSYLVIAKSLLPFVDAGFPDPLLLVDVQEGEDVELPWIEPDTVTLNVRILHERMVTEKGLLLLASHPPPMFARKEVVLGGAKLETRFEVLRGEPVRLEVYRTVSRRSRGGGILRSYSLAASRTVVPAAEVGSVEEAHIELESPGEVAFEGESSSSIFELRSKGRSQSGVRPLSLVVKPGDRVGGLSPGDYELVGPLESSASHPLRRRALQVSPGSVQTYLL